MSYSLALLMFCEVVATIELMDHEKMILGENAI